MKIAGKLLLILIIGVVLAFLSGNAIRNFMSYHFHHFPGKNIFIVSHDGEYYWEKEGISYNLTQCPPIEGCKVSVRGKDNPVIHVTQYVGWGLSMEYVAHADELNSGGYSKLYWHSYPIWNTPTLVMPFARKIVIPFVYMGHFAASPRPSVFAKATP